MCFDQMQNRGDVFQNKPNESCLDKEKFKKMLNCTKNYKNKFLKR